MNADRDEQIAAEVLEGRDVPDIAARYGVPEAYVDRVVEDAAARPRKRFGWGLDRTGNRITLAVVVGWIAAGTTPILARPGAQIWTSIVVGVIVYLLATLVSQGRT